METILEDKDKLEAILPVILELAHDEDDEDLRTLSLTLMSHFSSKIEWEFVEKILVSELISLSNDSALQVW